MRVTVGMKIAGGFFLVTLMLIVAGAIGFNGAIKLGGAVDYFANSAWKSGENASKLADNIQKKASLVGEIRSGVSPITTDQKKALLAYGEEANSAIESLQEFDIATPEQIDTLKAIYSSYTSSQQDLLNAHSLYSKNRTAAFNDFVHFEKFMKVFEFYSNNIYQLPNIEQGDKFELITYFFKTKLALQNRFYYIQRYLGGDEKALMLDELDTALEELEEESETLMELELTEAKIRSGEFEGHTYADYLTERVESHEQTFTSLVDSFQKFHKASERFEKVRLEMLVQVASIVSHITDTVTLAADESAETKSGVYTTTIVAIVVGLLIAVCATIFCVVSVVRPIIDIGKRMRDISGGGGDLTQTLPVKGDDEIAYLGKNFNKFLSAIRDIIAQTVYTSSKLEPSAIALQTLSSQTNDAAIQQQSGSEQIATALYEMVMSFQEVAENAANAEVTTNAANDSVTQSNIAVESNLSAIDQLSSDIGVAKQVIMELTQETESVGGILNVIQGIAEQTNLLALNAAIEAARAGNHGRGFAVVADEVRSLAQKTQQSTSEIQEVIDSLKGKSSEAVDVINRSFTQAESSVDYAKQVTHHLGIVGNSVGEVFQMNAQIAAAAEQQAAVTEDINKNVTQISDLSKQTALDAEKAADASNDVKQLVSGLTEIVGQFKI